jgi:hypothetical protein
VSPFQFAGLTFIVIAIWFGLQRGGDDWKGSGSSLPGSFLMINVANIIVGIFRQYETTMHMTMHGAQ